ncbi:pilus assembly FimT family protein [Haloferula helveola]|uniref:pilus assembly FimT family protein n=1 Tax=Haloferula helveola TaxID=490095 RepID=UPI0030CC31A7
MAVIAIVIVLLTIAVSLLGNTRGEALRSGSEQFSSLVEQARTSAITRRRPVAMAIAEPGTAGFDDDQCRIGLFELDEWKEGEAVSGRLIQRWHSLPDGIVFFGGEVDSLANVKDAASVNLTWKNGSESAEFPALVFSARGGLLAPPGSESVVVALGNGTYRNGEAVRTGSSGDRTIRIGRVVARAWNLES